MPPNSRDSLDYDPSVRVGFLSCCMNALGSLLVGDVQPTRNCNASAGSFSWSHLAGLLFFLLPFLPFEDSGREMVGVRMCRT